MSNQLRQAARAYREALAEETSAKEALAKAKARRDAAAEKVSLTRGPLADAIVASTQQGMRQKHILEAIENVYTRETIRRICRAAGVDPSE